MNIQEIFYTKKYISPWKLSTFTFIFKIYLKFFFYEKTELFNRKKFISWKQTMNFKKIIEYLGKIISTQS